MDPVSAFGLISGAVQVVQVIAQTAAGLATLRGKFNNADLTILSLIGELTTIKSAVIQLDDWAKYNARDSPERNEYDEGLGVALEGCRAVMDVLSQEVSSLTSNMTRNDTSIGFRTRVKVIWNEETMRGHQDRLHAQVLALQLLLQACQCRNSSEQVELLRRVENRRIIQKVADDTATLRTQSNYAASRADSLSHNQSSVGDTVFDFDDTVVASMAYRRALQHSRSRSDQQIPVYHDNRSRSTDEGYGSGIIASPAGSLSRGVPPIQHMASVSLPMRPYDPISPEYGRSKSATFNTNPLQSGQHHVTRGNSDSTYPSRASRSKREKLRSVLRRLSTTGTELKVTDSLSSSISPRRDREGDINTSIELTSPEGASAPVIVKMAQTGSQFDVERLIESGHDIEARHLHTRRNALLVAAHCGNEHIVNLLIQNNARLNTVDVSGCTALHLAASRGHCGVLALFLLEHIDIEARNTHGQTALWLAAAKGECDAAQVLISNHAKVNTRSNNQMTPLHAAAKQRNGEIVELLIANGADLEAKDGDMKTPLHYACEGGSLGTIELLLSNKANIDAHGGDRKTPLIYAAEMGRLLVVQHLLKRKAPTRSIDDSAMSALHWAAFNGHTEIVDLLCEKKGLLTMVNAAGRTALHLAIMNGQFAVVELLLRKNVNIRTRCQSGLDPLHYACISDSLEITRLLLISGSGIEVSADGDQRRPIHIAAARGSMGLLNLLCDKGALLNARDAVGDRALCVACRHGHTAAVQKLLERGSPLYQRFGNALHEDSPLCLAAMGGHLPVVSLLLQHGASVLRRDEMGWQPFRYAAYYGHPDVLRLLLSVSPELERDGPDFGLTAQNIGFAPHADISEERKRAVQEIFAQGNRQSRVVTMDMPLNNGFPINRGSSMFTPPPRPLPVSPFEPATHGNTVASTSAAPQELPSTLEHGLPSSRSHTPEQMHGAPRNSHIDTYFYLTAPAMTEANARASPRNQELAREISIQQPQALTPHTSRLLDRVMENPDGDNNTEARHVPNHALQSRDRTIPQSIATPNNGRENGATNFSQESHSDQHHLTSPRTTFVSGPWDIQYESSDSESISSVYTALEETAGHQTAHELDAS